MRGADEEEGVGWTKRRWEPGVRACLPHSRNNGSITAPPASDSITSSPLETQPPLLLSRSLFLSLFSFPFCPLSFRSPSPVSLVSYGFRSSSLSLFRRRFSLPAAAPASTTRLESCFLRPSPIPATPSFLYTTSFAVVGEGETPLSQ